MACNIASVTHNLAIMGTNNELRCAITYIKEGGFLSDNEIDEFLNSGRGDELIEIAELAAGDDYNDNNGYND